jgi:hypothetical protein
LTWWDLVKLAFGLELRDGACNIKRTCRAHGQIGLRTFLR